MRTPRQRNLKLTIAKPPAVREETVQANILQLLGHCQYHVYQTTVRYRRQTCPQCDWKFVPVGGTGTTPGVPDLLVHHPLWPDAVWIGIEVKGTKTALSPEQKALHATGHILVARSAEDALSQLQAAEEKLYGRVYGNRLAGG